MRQKSKCAGKKRIPVMMRILGINYNISNRNRWRFSGNKIGDFQLKQKYVDTLVNERQARICTIYIYLYDK